LKNRLAMDVRLLCPSEQDSAEQSLKSCHSPFLLNLMSSLQGSRDVFAEPFPVACYRSASNGFGMKLTSEQRSGDTYNKDGFDKT
jgi:hypothetical protein